MANESNVTFVQLPLSQQNHFHFEVYIVEKRNVEKRNKKKEKRREEKSKTFSDLLEHIWTKFGCNARFAGSINIIKKWFLIQLKSILVIYIAHHMN